MRRRKNRPRSPLPAGYAVTSPTTRDLFDVFDFQRDATDLLGAQVELLSDGALRNEHVSPDLVTAALL